MRGKVSIGLMIGLVMTGWPVAAQERLDRFGRAGGALSPANPPDAALRRIVGTGIAGGPGESEPEIIGRGIFGRTSKIAALDEIGERVPRRHVERSVSPAFPGRRRVTRATKVALAVASIVGGSILIWRLHGLAGM